MNGSRQQTFGVTQPIKIGRNEILDADRRSSYSSSIQLSEKVTPSLQAILEGGGSEDV